MSEISVVWGPSSDSLRAPGLWTTFAETWGSCLLILVCCYELFWMNRINCASGALSRNLWPSGRCYSKFVIFEHIWKTLILIKMSALLICHSFFMGCCRTPNFIIDGCIWKTVFLKFQFEGKSRGYFNDFACLPELNKWQKFILIRCGSSVANFEFSEKWFPRGFCVFSFNNFNKFV